MCCCSGTRARTRSASRSRTPGSATASSSPSSPSAHSTPSTTPSPTPRDRGPAERRTTVSPSTTPNRKPRNLAARMGRWSANHWKTATFGWLALIVVAFGIGGLVGTRNPDPATSGPGESGRMDRILHADFKRPAAENVLVQSRTATVGTPAFAAVVKDVVARVSREADVRNVRSPLEPGNAEQISKDRHAALVNFDIRGEIDKSPDKIGPVVSAVAAAQAAHPGFFVGEIGDASGQKAIADAYGSDLGKAG